jgi:hypothetical protein
LFYGLRYRDKKVVGVLCVFSDAPLQQVIMAGWTNKIQGPLWFKGLPKEKNTLRYLNKQFKKKDDLSDTEEELTLYNGYNSNTQYIVRL